MLIVSLCRQAQAFALAVGLPFTSQAGRAQAGDYLACDGQAVSQFTADGLFVRRLAVDGEQTRGVAFGPDGLYVVLAGDGGRSRVAVLDAHGEVARTYAFDGAIGGLLTSGNLRFAPGRRVFYVAAEDGLYRFPVDGRRGAKLVGQSAHDVAVLPDGSLLVAGSASVSRYAADGRPLGSVGDIADPLGLAPSGAGLAEVRGLAYDARTDTTFVTAIGGAGFFDTLLAFQGTTNELKGVTTVEACTGLDVVGDGRLLVGSWSVPPAVFAVSATVPMRFERTGTLATASASFVASRAPGGH